MPDRLVTSRLDTEVVRRGLAPSRDKARVLVMAGEVFIDGQCVLKADKKISPLCQIEIRKKYPFVSRAAFKIKKVIEEFGIDLNGLNILDIGISTGGFSDFMLQNGAEKVMGVDVNTGQVDFSLRQHKRLILLKKNARFLQKADIPFDPDLITIDVSFISITRIIPALKVFPHTRILALVKPQFEAERSEVRKGGVIRDRDKLCDIVLRVKRKIEELNFSLIGFLPAGVKGKKGNQEYFFLLGYGKKSRIDDKIIENEIKVQESGSGGQVP
jgi:23S rRNA (cytidine1920-2'-O)/16S rRNA (cytidine1409-2'-O)-methyltransferase